MPFATPAFAQTDTAPPASQPETGASVTPVAPQTSNPDAREATDDIVVTGTLIQNPNLQKSTPVAVIGADEIALRQSNVAEEVLRTLPGSVPGVGSNVSFGSRGAATVNLRGLGANRNVVLLNGTRIVPTDLNGFADLNNVPLALVDRVEVLTGGASTTYGADAVSGVVNFVTRRNFSGFELTASKQITERGDAAVARVDAVAGHNFAGGRGNVVLGLSYQTSDALFQDARDYAAFNIGSATGIASGSTISVPGAFSLPGQGTRQINTATGAFSTLPAPAGTTRSLFNVNPFQLFQTPLERYNAYAAARYEISPAVEVYGEGLFSRPPMIIGSKPIDGGFYIFTTQERSRFEELEPGSAALFVPFIGSHEFINGEERWLLWVAGLSPSDLAGLPHVRHVISQVRDFRLGLIEGKNKRRIKEGSVDAARLAEYPTRFHVTVRPTTPFLVVPETSSERRDYIPIGWAEPPTIPSSLVRIVPEATPLLFGILTSRMHNAWLKYIGGRMKSDPRYSIDIVYNTFPMPDLDEKAEQVISDLAVAVLEERAKWQPGSSLAHLYDPLGMPPELKAAHRRLDAAVDKAYRRESFASDRHRVEHLMALYERENAPLTVRAAAADGPRRRGRPPARPTPA